MSDAILVLNAGSSSIKFSLFAFSGAVESLSFLLGGQVQGLQSTPQFKAKDAGQQVFFNVVGPQARLPALVLRRVNVLDDGV